MNCLKYIIVDPATGQTYILLGRTLGEVDGFVIIATAAKKHTVRKQDILKIEETKQRFWRYEYG